MCWLHATRDTTKQRELIDQRQSESRTGKWLLVSCVERERVGLYWTS